MKRVLREPLLHFVVLGAAFFVAYGLGRKSGSGEPRKIVVTQGQVEHLVTGFARTWQRPPSSEELAGLIRDQVREEVYCREATALGLDKDDSVIRRRLAQKMEFISNDVAARVEPSDADLNAYLQTHAEGFRLEPRFTFRHVYLDPERHGADLARDTARLLVQLTAAGDTADVSALGDPFLLEHELDGAPAGDVARQFGEPFAKALARLDTGRWQGPVESGYGLHLVFVRERTEGRVPALSEVREAVRRAWDDERRSNANEKFYRELLKRYTVTIEESPKAEPKKLAGNTLK
ncbi:MAG TPA: peptidylprolyl isomerase [Thermoanaerobaculia bacterium]|nr:peptidylprolyl isomerase [Thermoanaerobaculia bacterium]